MFSDVCLIDIEDIGEAFISYLVYNATSFQDSNFPSDQNLDIAFITIPILILSLVFGGVIMSYHESLNHNEKNIMVFLDKAVTDYLQDIYQIFLKFSKFEKKII